MIVHDLRCPLAVVAGSLKLIEESLDESSRDSELRRAVDLANNGIQRLSDTIDSYLEIGQFQSAHRVIDCHPCALADIVREATTPIAPLIENAQISLDVDVPECLPLVEADESLVRRVLIDLLDNAVKFTPPGGSIVVSGGVHSGAQVRCTISDTGTGIPDEYHEQIFRGFTQLSDSQTPRRGTGFGLMFCRLAVEALGGAIWVESEETRGSRFHFTLPISKTHRRSIALAASVESSE